MEKFWNPSKILEKNCQYNLIIGERSNGKTYGVLKMALENYIQNNKQLAIIRRWQDDFRGKRGATMFDNIVSNGDLEKITNKKWNSIYYYSGRWFLCNIKGDKKITDSNPFAYGFALTSQEHDKSTAYPNINLILFDEFLSRDSYLPDEFVIFMNVLSTIIRSRDDVKIFMLGNTVNQYCPYFAEMGLSNIKNMKKGDIDVYSYGNSSLKVAVEFSDSINKKGKKSDVYFAFNNPKLKMITSGTWEISIYPHLPYRYLPKEIIFKYYIIFNGELLQAEIICQNDVVFTYIHRKTTPIKDVVNSIIFQQEYNPRPNYYRDVTSPRDKVSQKIISFFNNSKVFYQDNEIGEIVRNYIMWCNSNSITSED